MIEYDIWFKDYYTIRCYNFMDYIWLNANNIN